MGVHGDDRLLVGALRGLHAGITEGEQATIRADLPVAGVVVGVVGVPGRREAVSGVLDEGPVELGDDLAGTGSGSRLRGRRRGS